MVTRAEATAENLKLIAAALDNNSLILQARESGKITSEVENTIALAKQGISIKDQPSTDFSSNGISREVQKLQQELSELFGIPTFDAQGNISTIPQTRLLDPSIDVGLGRYSAESFNTSLVNLSNLGQQSQAAIAPIKDVFVQGIEEFVRSVFDMEDRENLTPQEVAAVTLMEKRIAELEKQLVPVPTLRSTKTVYAYQNGRPLYQTATNSREVEGAQAHNAPIHKKINEIKAERVRFITEHPITRALTEKVEELTAELRDMSQVSKVTPELKASISTKISQSQKLLEEINTKGVKIDETSIALLQIAMKAGGFKLQEETNVQAAVVESKTNDFWSSAGRAFEEIGAGISATVTDIAQGFEQFLAPDPDVFVKNYLNQVEAQKRLANPIRDGVDLDAARVEKVQKDLAGS